MVQGARWLDSGPLGTEKKKQRDANGCATVVLLRSARPVQKIGSKVVLRTGQCQTTTEEGQNLTLDRDRKMNPLLVVTPVRILTSNSTSFRTSTRDFFFSPF